MDLSKNNFKWRLGLKLFTGGLLLVMMTLLVLPGVGMAAGKPKTVEEIALYRGSDREKMLIEGARKEGEFIFYTSNSWMTNVVSKEFDKKYPFLKASVARMRGKEVIMRTMEEYAAGRYKADALESSSGNIAILHKNGIFQECYTPEAGYYADEVKIKGKTGVYALADRELYYGLGFNTVVVSPGEAPKGYMDLLDPKWKGKMSIVGSSTGIRWIGSLMHVMGREYIEKLSRQDIKVQHMTAAALATLIVAGEVPISPTAGQTNLRLARGGGAPVDWRPFSPTLTTIGMSGITTRAPHPHAAMLFFDYLHSKEGQQVVMKGRLFSPRKDIGSVEQDFKKDYIDSKYPIEVYEKKFNEWEKILRQLFIRR